MNNSFSELRCPNCLKFYNCTSNIPMILINCGHNICKYCIETSKKSNCCIDNKLINSKNVIENHLLNELFSKITNDDSIKFDEEKAQEEDLSIKVDLLNEYIMMITESYELFKKEEKKNKEVLTFIKKYLIKNKNKQFVKNKNNGAFTYKISDIDELEKNLNKISNNYNSWKDLMKKFLDKINTSLYLLPSVNDENEELFTEEGSHIMDESENLLKNLNNFCEKVYKVKLYKKDIEKKEKYNNQRKLLSSSKLSSIHKKGKNVSLTSPNIPTDQSSSSTNTNNNERNNSFTSVNYSSNPLKPFSILNDQSKEVSKDVIFFIKTKLKSEILNCSGYSIGNEGCKGLVTLIIKNNIKCSTGTINYKELRLSKCDISEDGLHYINTFLDITKNTIIVINISKNKLNDESINILSSIIKKNRQLKELRLINNYFSDEGKKKIESLVKDNNLDIKIEI